MRCLNCNKKIPKTARACQYCESVVEPEPTKEEKEAVLGLLGQMVPEALEELGAVLDESATADEFVDRIFVGDCPTCGSRDTGNCENDPEIGEFLVGRCFQCGQLWCTECLRLLESGSASCPCWSEEELDEP